MHPSIDSDSISSEDKNSLKMFNKMLDELLLKQDLHVSINPQCYHHCVTKVPLSEISPQKQCQCLWRVKGKSEANKLAVKRQSRVHNTAVVRDMNNPVGAKKRKASAAQPSTVASTQSISKPSSGTKEFITLKPTSSKCANASCQKKHFKIIFCSPFHKNK